jgi:hypothetical protein
MPARADALGRGRPQKLRPLRQPTHDLVKLFEIAVANVHAAPGIAMVDIDGKAKRVADALLQRDRIGVLYLAAPRLLRFASRHTLDMRQRLGLAYVETLLDDTLGGSQWIGHADQCACMAG